jgi:CRP-like cAMP-binding protein
MLTFLCLYIAIALPFTLGFGQFLEDYQKRRVSTSELAIDIIFLFDVALNFRTGLFGYEGQIIMDWQTVATTYLRTWFLVDFLSSVPIEVISGGHLGSIRFAKLFKMPKMVRIFKLMGPMMAQSSELLGNLDQFLNSPGSRSLCRRSSVFVVTFFLAHWMACFMPFSGTVWLTEYQDVEGSLSRLYLAAVYWAMTTMTTVGYGDITPQQDSERAYTIVAMTIGGAYYGYAVGTICSIVANNDLNASAYHDRMDLLYSWLDHHAIPVEMRKRILKYFKTFLREKSAVNDSEIVDDLSPALRKEVGQFVVHDDIRQNPLFDNLAINAVIRLQKIIQNVSVDSDSYIVTQDEAGTAMFIIRTGHLKIARPGKPPQTLSAGDSFGEEVVAGLTEKYHYSVQAVEDSHLFMLEEGEFADLFVHMPDVLVTMKNNALELTRHWLRDHRPEHFA